MKKLKYWELTVEEKKLNLTKFGFSLDGFGFENRDLILNSKGTHQNNYCHLNKAQILDPTRINAWQLLIFSFFTISGSGSKSRKNEISEARGKQQNSRLLTAIHYQNQSWRNMYDNKTVGYCYII